MQKIWINGEQVRALSVTDRALAYGDGLFETIRVEHSKPQLMDAHLQRLQFGLDRLKFPANTLKLLLSDLESVDLTGNHVLKVTITRGEGERGYALPSETKPNRIIQLSALVDHSDRCTSGVSITLCKYQMAINPALAGLKHLNRLEQVLARSEWNNASNYAEGVVTDRDGYIVEGTMSNIFWVTNNTVYTPLLDRCGVEGVMRNHILAELETLSISVNQGHYKIDELIQADEIFVTNSLIKLWPVTSFETTEYEIGPVSRKLQSLLVQERLC